MSSQMKNAAILTVLLLTTSCAIYRLEELRRATPQGSPFQKALAKHYMDFARDEEKQYDWWDSAYFAGKGLGAVYGKDVPPEELTHWHIPKDKLPELQKARIALVEALRTASVTRPELAAKAQYYFDCWVEQQDEDWQDEDIARCRDGLLDALLQLTVPDDTAILPDPKGPTPLNALPETISYVVFFDKGQSVLSEAGKLVIEEVLRATAPLTGYDVLLNRANGQNGDLYNARAAVVRQRLIDGGIKEHAIVLVGDKKKRAQRRIEIFLND